MKLSECCLQDNLVQMQGVELWEVHTHTHRLVCGIMIQT